MIWTHFLLQLNLYLILFFLLFKILLAKETHFTLNRVYLIGASILALVLPFLRFEWIREQELSQKVYEHIEDLGELAVMPVDKLQDPELNWSNWIIGVYVCGLFFFSARFLFRLFLVRKSLKTVLPGAAFSFFNKKVVAHDVPASNIIHFHEETHINQKHSWDVIFFEILQIFTWFNPIIYAYKIAIKNIHEYLADEAAAKYQGCKESYALLILSQTFKTDINQLTNKFYTQSQVKKRIYMLYKERSTKRAIWKYGLVAPIFALALILSASTIQNNKKLLNVAQTLEVPVKDFIQNVQEKQISQKKPSLKGIEQAPVIVEPEEIIPTLTFEATIEPIQEENISEIKKTIIINNAPSEAYVAKKPVQVLEAMELDMPPSYPGGIEKFYDLIRNSIKYPEEAFERNKQGTVFLSFIVEPDGSISNVNTLGKKLGFGLEEEALRVLQKSKTWKPGYLANKPIRSKFQVPIRFTLPNDNFDIILPEVKTRGSIAFVMKSMISGTSLSGLEDAWYVVNGEITDYQGFSAVNPQRIERISYLSPNDAKNQYGSNFSKGAIIIETAPEY